MSVIDSTGFSISSLDEKLTELIALAQNIFGPDINVDPNSYDGQLLTALAEAINNVDQLAQIVYNSFNPDTAIGNALSTLVKLNYITRQSGAYSTVAVTVVGSQGTIIPSGFICQSNDGSKNQWMNLADVEIGSSGTAIIQCRATQFGATAATIGTITEPITGVFGLDSISNATPAIVGRLQETDEQLRVRRALSTGANGGGTIDAIRGSILNIIGVTQAQVYENNTETTNTDGQPGNSVYAVVLGGDDQDIWNALWFKKPAGIDTEGAQVGTVVDTAGWPQTVKFDRPTPTPIYIIANVKSRLGFPADASARIKAALVAWAQANQGIGDAVIQSELYAPLMTSINNTGSILSLYIGFAPTPTTTTDLTVAYNAIASFDPSQIVVNIS